MKENFEVKKKTDSRFKRAFVTNVVKTLVAYVVTSLFGYLMYRFTINGTNIQSPKSALLRTVIFGLFAFSLLIYLAGKIFMLPVKDERSINEMKEIDARQKACGYTLDYKAYFKEQLKTRLWGSFVLIFVLQLPLIINYAMVSRAAGFSIYTSPIGLYKFYTPSLFVWELLGDAWFLAPILFPVIYAAVFSFHLYREQKKRIPQKPDWYDSEAR